MLRKLNLSLVPAALVGACALLGATVGTSLAQVTVTVPPPGRVEFVELRPNDADGGFTLTAFAQTTSPEGVSIARSVQCDGADLTAGQRTCVGTIRNAALSCWRGKAIDGGI